MGPLFKISRAITVARTLLVAATQLTWFLLLPSAARGEGLEYTLGGLRADKRQLVWERDGHLQLGIVLSLTTYRFHEERLCGTALRSPSALHRLHAIVFAIDEINRRSDILPGIKLGFVAMDDCSRSAAALLRALQFIRRPGCPGQPSTTFANGSSPFRQLDLSSLQPSTQTGASFDAGSVAAKASLLSATQTQTDMMDTSPATKMYSVVGVLGAELSDSSIQMATLLSAFRVPQLSYASSSPFLSDKTKYSYFSRIVPSDRQQAVMIVDLLEEFHWDYVAVVYSYDVYGLSGFRYIRQALEGKGFCLAASIATESEFEDRDFDDVIDKLLNITPRVKVVVMFSLHATKVLRAAFRYGGLGGRFMWVSSDTLIPNIKDFQGYEDIALGLLLISFRSAPVQRFQDQFQYSTLRNSSENPWFGEFYERMFNCTMNETLPDLFPSFYFSSPSFPSFSSGDRRCNPDLPLVNSSLYERNTSVTRAMNSVYAFAYALHNVTRNCPYKLGNVMSCFTSEDLLHSLRHTDFKGENGVRVKIGANGDGIAMYQVHNLRVDEGVYSFAVVGEWCSDCNGASDNISSVNKSFELDKRAIMWHPRWRLHEEKLHGVDAYGVSRNNDGGENRHGDVDGQGSGGVAHVFADHAHCGGDEDNKDGEGCFPRSTCRDQCKPGFQAVPIWPRCCWVCKACRENEYTDMQDNLPVCQTCPTADNFTWPDPATRTTCQPIAATFVSFNSHFGQVLLVVDLVVLALVLACCALYFRSRKTRLIKATSRELSAVMLVGQVLACLAVPVFILEPSSASCLVSHSAFQISLTLVYASLLVKINRIHRIFVSGRKSVRKPRFIGSGCQVLVSLVVVQVHLLIIVVYMVMDPPSVQTRMPSYSEEYVELVCVIPRTGFRISLVINLVLMAASAVHSLSTRHLPANFNEAKFILICVYTIAVLWMSFLGTYYVLDNIVVHTLCLSLALLVNVISCQVFLFIPKLYAVRQLPSSKLHVLSDPLNGDEQGSIRGSNRQ